MGSLAAAIAAASLIGTLGARSDIPQRAAANAAAAPVKACSVLPNEEVRAILGVEPKRFNLIPPQEDTLPGGGSACEYMGAGIQIDPFTPARLEELRKQSGQAWAAVTGVGDAAYYHARNPLYAELYARSGTHVVTVQMSVDSATSAETARPKAVALAKALLAKLH
jgi:hypothetical protein